MSYSSVYLLYHQRPQLIFNGPYSNEYVAGLFIGLYTLFRYEAGLNPHYIIEMRTINDEIQQFNLLDSSGFLDFISQFVMIEGETPFNLKRNSRVYRYGWWIRATYLKDIRYNLYIFDSPDFISGFISAFKDTNYDFRDYIAGPPFVYDNVSQKPQPITVAGYQIKTFDPYPRVSGMVVPFETMSYIIGVPDGIDYD